MAADLSVSITVSAIVGGALSGLTNIGKAMNTLKTATNTLTFRQKELGETLERNKDRLGVASARQLWQEYDRIGASIRRLKQQYQELATVRSQQAANQQQWLDIKSQWQGAVAAAGLLVLPVKLAVDFESAMADVRKVVNFDTPQQFQEMQRDILALTRDIPMAGKEIAAIVASGGQSGVARKDLIGFAGDAAKMGVAFDMAAGQAGESMATLSNVLQIPISKMSLVGDAINHLSDNANSKAADIVNVLTRAGSDMKQLGLNENQGAAWASTFLSFGKAPDLAAQAIKGMASSLSVLKAGGGQKELAELGLTTREFARAMNEDAQGAISDLLARIRQLPKDRQYPLLMKMFGRQYADDVVLLAGGVEEYNRQLDLLSEKDASGNLKYLGSMQREFENRSATTANQFQILKNGLMELGITVGSFLLPVVNDFLGTGIKAANMLADWAAKHPGLAKAIISVVSALLAFRIGLFGAMVVGNRAKAVFLSLKGAYLSLKSAATLTQAVMQGGMKLADVPGRLGSVMRAFSAARTTMLGFSVSSLVAMWPIVLVVAAIAAAAFLIYKYWGPVKSFFIGVWEGIKEGFAPALPLLEAFWNGLKELGAVVAEVFEPLIDWFGEFLTANTEASAEVQDFGHFVGAVLGGLLAAVVQTGAMIIDGWRMIFDAVSNLVSSKTDEVQTAFNGGLTGILGLILNWSPIGAFHSAFAAVLSWFGIELPAKFTEFGSNIISGLWNGLKARFEEVKAWFSGVAGWFAAKFQNSNEIKSPSRLFKRFGGWMMEGLQIGLGNGSARPLAAIGSVASDLQQRFKNRSGTLSAELAASMQANSAEFAAARQAQAGGAVTIHFNPTIHAPGGDVQQIQSALQMGLREFEDLFNRLMDERARRAY